jgi:hypothetical protein
MCRKRAHPTPEEAQAEADRLYARDVQRGMDSPAYQFLIYKCPHCRGWHVGYIYVTRTKGSHHVSNAIP